MKTPIGDAFLSEEDLDLQNLSDEEFWAWLEVWFEAAQASNDLDEHSYSHGVFEYEPGYDPRITKE